jgi:NMD protein affecting ribosome stability and mRNA decay
MKGPRIIRKKAIDTAKDPYLQKISPSDMAVCKGCGAIYHNKRWSLDKKLKTRSAGKKKVEVLCPACQKIKEGFAEGFVTIKGEFFKKHREEIINLMRNKEQRAMYNNPLDRIIEIKEKKDSIEIATTTDKLAQRLGQVIQKAFNGEIEYKWSSDTKLTRVVWTRDATSK